MRRDSCDGGCAGVQRRSGAALTSEGKVSMDACLMTGDGEVGSAAGLTTARHPIDVARAVKERTKHTMFALPGEDLLRSWGIELRDPSYFVTEERRRSLARAQSEGDAWEKHGTIGAVARDAAGHVAAGTSTGGITNQMPGRVGDSPLPGCGTYAADDSVAVSCTGIGEAFVRSVAAHQIADRVRFAGQSVQEAAQAALDDVAARARRRRRHRHAGQRRRRHRLQQRDDELRIRHRRRRPRRSRRRITTDGLRHPTTASAYPGESPICVVRYGTFAG